MGRSATGDLVKQAELAPIRILLHGLSVAVEFGRLCYNSTPTPLGEPAWPQRACSARGPQPDGGQGILSPLDLRASPRVAAMTTVRGGLHNCAPSNGG